jgi:hypothetical protein
MRQRLEFFLIKNWFSIVLIWCCSITCARISAALKFSTTLLMRLIVFDCVMIAIRVISDFFPHNLHTFLVFIYHLNSSIPFLLFILLLWFLNFFHLQLNPFFKLLFFLSICPWWKLSWLEHLFYVSLLFFHLIIKGFFSDLNHVDKFIVNNHVRKFLSSVLLERVSFEERVVRLSESLRMIYDVIMWS